jgi:hypothetical protein
MDCIVQAGPRLDALRGIETVKRTSSARAEWA